MQYDQQKQVKVGDGTGISLTTFYKLEHGPDFLEMKIASIGLSGFRLGVNMSRAEAIALSDALRLAAQAGISESAPALAGVV